MTDKTEKNQIEPQSDPMMDTQYLLGMGPPAEGEFALEEILEEFSPTAPDAPPPMPTPAPPEPVPAEPPHPVQEAAAPAEPVPPPAEPPPASRRKWWSRKRAAPPEPEAPPAESEPSGQETAEAPETMPEVPEITEEMLDQEFFADMLPDTSPGDTAVPPAETPPDDAPPAEEPPETPKEPEPETPEPAGKDPGEPEPPEETPSPPSAKANAAEPAAPMEMESIENLMAHTVDAVKEEQEQRQERLQKKLEKARKAVSRSFSKKEEPLRRSFPDVDNEPPPAERAMWHKRRVRDSRKSLRLSALVTLLLWLPWVLDRFGIATPFFSDSADNAALCVLVPHAVAAIVSWPVFRAALEYLRDGVWTLYATSALCTVVTLLDEMTMLLLPERTDAAPLGGLASLLLVFTLWGLTGLHRGLSESLRTIAMGEPSRAVDRYGTAVAKGNGSRRGFYTRLALEDAPAQWQRLLLPVLAAASPVFALLSSVGQGQPQNFLWCWSVIFCSASSLVFPLTYCVPFGRLAARLARSGTALAGQYGAAILASTRRLAVTDEDMFPQNTVSLGGLKLYGEERNKAISYTATLAVQAGGNLARIFKDVCETERISFQGLEHFHIHDDGGLSGIIHGETVLVGTPVFMRHKAVRLPGSMPSKTCICLAVDGHMQAVFVIKYTSNDLAEYALRSAHRNGLQITLATRDSNASPKLLKECFGISGNVQYPDLSERLTLSDPERDVAEPNGLMYRDGLLQLVSLAVGSSRLCQTALIGNLLAILSSIAGVLLGFYLTFTGSYEVLTPVLLATYALLWVAPMLPLVWTVDKL